MSRRSPEIKDGGEFSNRGPLEVARAIRGTELLERAFPPEPDFPIELHSSLPDQGGCRYAILFAAVTFTVCGAGAFCVGILSNLPTLK
ncbi:MAG: hypothetical protein UV61_C0008G0038 [Candidatus Gottesmanbacteria bacterium GW2011_GWB1_43_11]|uniref:Uncharacterized protein n=1 Tax=Candidatus Gottesmanbacteria bacterium GW2011_GWB1_43_11 TaxID=1618446 RepID=A0A0G1CLD4_9BACT|nr:MAG: hypothetical protein UV04_C0003G0039 [Candidatus Gottesmanbacteria bacterium GW2011_GWA2_42_16]KKS50815.1 MAG: hypothetical protein UV17_C0068G0002 [Candidatus Gottesmanbacteria bacterium GW2011_GWA1_42_26]KKS80755.1 MAG: hypothetical protein UV55_C0031G0032 [Candidatus Gottesmanbacteria bacterium GW2011_GWC1_43_10]KKS86585.1 MAG: hypothetical protein UV61_C0008G0038 [Candidatus Gottesmanbacteria bacterium GW2011_GWB1_43_11]OGG09177.1 MAG: hypothetical protein A2699_02290 [Candidatus Go